MAIDRKKLTPYDNRLLEIINRLEETIPSCYAGVSPYGMCINCRIENGLNLNFTVDPYIDYGSTVRNPEKVNSFTVSFVVYTEDGKNVNIISGQDLDEYLQNKPITDEKICSVFKEMAGYTVKLDRKEYFEAQSALADRERREAYSEIEETSLPKKSKSAKVRKASRNNIDR